MIGKSGQAALLRLLVGLVATLAALLGISCSYVVAVPAATATPTATPVPYNPLTALAFNGYYDARLGVTLTGGAVSAWASQEGGETFTQGVAAARPTLTSSAFGSNPGVFFGSGLHTMASSTGFLTGSSGYIATVVRIDDFDASGVTAFLSSANTGDSTRTMAFGFQGITEQVTNQQRNNDTTDRVEGDADLDETSAYVVEYWSDGSGYFVRLSGGGYDAFSATTQVLSGANSGDWFADTTGLNLVSLGYHSGCTCLHFRGTLGVLALVDGSVPTLSERNALRDYLVAEWL